MKYVLGLILSLITGNAFAESIPFPMCTVNNQPVGYISVTSNFDNSYARTGKVHVAGASFINGRPTIDYNSSLMSTTPKEWNLQVMLHECGHLKLGHIHQPPSRTNIEYEADCYSATVLKNKYGYKEEEFNIIIRTMKEFLPPDRITAFKSCLNR
jgi:hypothetical protein